MKKSSRIICAFVTGFIIAVSILEEDARVQELIAHHINILMSDTYNCHFIAHVKKMRLFAGKIELGKAVVSAPDTSWSWSAERILVSVSLYQLITKRIIALSYDLFDVSAHTTITGNKIPILEHITALIQVPTTIPTHVDRIKIHTGTLSMNRNTYAATVLFELTVNERLNKYHIDATIHDGMLEKDNRKFIQKIDVTFLADIDPKTEKISDVSIKGKGILSVNGIELGCHIEGVIGDNGLILDYYSDDRCIQGAIQYNTNITITMNASVNKCIRVLGYSANDIDGQAQATVLYDVSTGQLHGSYTVDFKKNDYTDTIAGVITTNNREIIITGACHEHAVKILLLYDTGMVHEINYSIGETSVFSVHNTAQNSFSGQTQIETVLPFLAWTGLCGTGTITFSGSYISEGLSIEFAITDAALRIPSTYHLIKSVHARCLLHLKEQYCTIQDLSIQFFKGSITAQKSTIYYDTTGTVMWAHIPLFFNHCFLSWQKELFAQFSGSCTLCYAKDLPLLCKSSLMLERSHIRGNILAPEFQKQILALVRRPSANILKSMIDIHIQSREPVSIKTPFLDASAHIFLSLQGDLPEIDGSGAITLVQGQLKFPYKPLYITEGKLYFLRGQLYDPHIELNAKNSIKKYSVTMAIRGSIQEPLLSFASSPTLDEAQIITLLLGGSEDGSLYFALPETMKLSLKNMIFGSAQSSSKIIRSVRKLLRPLENIRIVPSFTDQSGRGGVRGSLVVEVNDRLRGFIEKNFNLSEDVKFGVEYDISDDTSVRGVRDERGDLGGEVEMRFRL